MRYDIGDKVLIKSIDWYDANKDRLGDVWFHDSIFLKAMAKYCGKITTIKEVTKGGYRLKDIPYFWNDKMIEGLVEMKNVNNPDNDKIIQSWLDFLCPQWKGIKIELDKKRKKENNHLDKEKRVLFEEVNSWPDCKILESYLTKEDKIKDMGEVSDGYHTFNELYEYRKLYNAALFNEWANIPGNPYNVHKSKLHSDGKIPFGDPNWFIVMAELSTGQISNHYEMKDWDLFQIPTKEKADVWDGHTPKDVAERIRRFLTPKPKYPTTYEECCEVLKCSPWFEMNTCYHGQELCSLYKLLLCRDAYWKIAGEEMGLRKPWDPEFDNLSTNLECFTCSSRVFSFPTKEMRDAFNENFKELLNYVKNFYNMTQKQTELLFKDLCGRLPYGVKGVNMASIVSTPSDWHCAFTISEGLKYKIEGSGWRPYLFPLSSMSEEQKKEWQSLMIKDAYGILYYTVESFDYLHKNHFDYRGLIPKGLAIDATGLNIYKL